MRVSSWGLIVGPSWNSVGVAVGRWRTGNVERQRDFGVLARAQKEKDGDSTAKKVVVVGGGWAGFAAAKHLSEQDGIQVTLLDAQENPGGLSTAFLTKQGREIEAGVKGFWEDYPNIQALCDELEIQPMTDFLTSGFWALPEDEGSAGVLVTEAPVFSSKPQLPTILGQFFFTSPLFYRLSLADRATIIPWLYDVINFAKDETTYKEYDSMSAREMFKRAGVSDNAYEYFLKPTLAVGLFAPPEELSAAVTLELLCFYALNSQNSFDVRWCKGSIAKKIFGPLVDLISKQGGTILGSRFVTQVEVCEETNSVRISAINNALKKPKVECIEADAVCFALSISGMKKIISSSPSLANKPEFQGIMNLRSIDCIATRIWFDQFLPTRFPANVLANFEPCGATYFNTTEMQGKSDGDPGTVISADFYGASALLPLSDEEIVSKVYSNICKCDPIFRDAMIVDSAVLRFTNAVTHFSPGSYAHRPRQATSSPAIVLAGDYVKDVPHGANGLSQERAWVTGLLAANMILDFFQMDGMARVYPSHEDEPHIALAKQINKTASSAFSFLPKSTF